MKKDYIYIDALEVVKKFGYLIKGGGAFSGLEFAKRIIRSEKDCKPYRENCASSVASSVFEIQYEINGRCLIIEIL